MTQNPRHPRWPIQVFRIASLVVPPAFAWDVAFSAPHPTRLTVAVTYLLGPLWLLMAGALIARSVDALLLPRRSTRSPVPKGELSLLDRIDVLTASGSSMVWLGSGAIAASVWIGWASLSVVGLMGLCFVQLVVLWTLVVAGGDDPFRLASVSRRFVPASVFEGDPVIEELRLLDARIPTGFRLFAGGRVGLRWAQSRYVVGEEASGGEVLLERNVGPALRGEHRAEPLEVWLQDVFGLCHSVRRRTGAAALTVLPRLRPVDGARELLGHGGHDLQPRPATRLPTEGSLRLREYQPGEDARRIHWVRSLTARQIVVRLPDELPPDQPSVRLVLDTFLTGAEALSCAAHEELLDALVRVWLGVARSLVESGARVTLVTAAPRDAGRDGGDVVQVRRRLTAEALAPALRLGAQARWQDALRAEDLLSTDPSIVVTYRLQPDPVSDGGSAPKPSVRSIIVPVSVWARFDEPLQQTSLALLPHPIGSPENRWSRRRRERMRLLRVRRDRALLVDSCSPTRNREDRAGSFVARPVNPARILVEAL